MRTWRVGTISSGVFLIVFGVSLVLAQFNKLLIYNLFKWWPVLLVILGLEILASSVLNRGQEERVKYDILSVFVVIFFLIAGGSMQFLNDSGFLSVTRSWFLSEKYLMETGPERLEIGPDIKQLVITNPEAPLELISGKETAVSCSATVRVQAETKQEAEIIASDCIAMHSRIVNDTMYLSFDQSFPGNPWQHFDMITELKVIIPDSVAIVSEGSKNETTVVADRILRDWDLRNAGATEMYIKTDNNCMVTAIVGEERDLLGNVTWQKTRGTESSNETTDASRSIPTTGKVCLGSGERLIRIDSSDKVKIFVDP